MKKITSLLVFLFCSSVYAQKEKITLELQNEFFEFIDTLIVTNSTDYPIYLKLNGVPSGNAIAPHALITVNNFAQKVWNQKYEFSIARVKEILNKVGIDSTKQNKTVQKNFPNIEIKIPKIYIHFSQIQKTILVDGEKKEILKAIKTKISGKNIKGTYELVRDVE